MNESIFIEEVHPYLLRYDGWIAGIFLFCFFAMTYVLAQGRYVLIQHTYNFFQTRERKNVFVEKTVIDTHCQLLLLLQTCILVSVLFYEATIDYKSEETLRTLFPLYVAVTILFCIVKWIAYRFVNWVFFDSARNKQWTDSYFFTLSLFGILLFPVSLLVVYLEFSPFWSGIICVFLFIFAVFLKLYKSFCIFFSGLHGVLFLFLYFCTLEILPLLVLGKGIRMINELQI